MNKTVINNGLNEKAALTATALFVFAAGAVMGSVYLMKIETTEGISGFLKEYMNSAGDGMNSFEVFKNALKNNMLMLLCMFAAGFFRIGFLFVAACIVRKGFIMGFTAAAFFRLYGLKGCLMGMSFLPAAVVAVPAIIIYAAASGALSLSKNKKNFLLYYFFITIFTITIFCVASFMEGYITTIFIKGVSKMF